MSGLDVDKGAAVLTSVWAVSATACVFVIARLLVRLRILKKAGWDDGLISLSMVSLLLRFFLLGPCNDQNANKLIGHWLRLRGHHHRRSQGRIWPTRRHPHGRAIRRRQKVQPGVVYPRLAGHCRAQTGRRRLARANHEPQPTPEVHSLE